MAKIYLFSGPTTEELEGAKMILDNLAEHPRNDGQGSTIHIRFRAAATVSADCDISKLPQLVCRVTEIPGTVRLNLQHLAMTAETLEYKGDDALMLDGVDAGQPGAVLHIVYSMADHTGTIDHVEAPRNT